MSTQPTQSTQYAPITGTPEPSTALRPGPGWLRRRLGTAALALLLTGCKVLVVVPEGGTVVSDEGFLCEAGETCTLNVNDTGFSQHFEAIAAEGYEFAHWQQADDHFCGGSALTCFLTTAGFAGNASLEALLASDNEYFLAPVFTPTDTRYQAAEWAQLLDELNTGPFRSESYLYEVLPTVSGCQQGKLTNEARTRFHDSVNLIRRLHELPPVHYQNAYNGQLQKAALVQLANNYLSHSPSPSATCYSAAAATGAGSSNLYGGSGSRDPAYHAIGWANDNRNISSLMEAGHRRWMLYPQLGITAYGQAGGYAAMKVFGFSPAASVTLPPELEFVAFPYQQYPYVLVSRGASPTPWSLSMVPAAGASSRYDYFSGATVVVTEVSSGNPMTVTDLHQDTRGYGLANFLSWMVQDWDYDTWYQVTISNINMPDSSVKEISYPVRVEYSDLR